MLASCAALTLASLLASRPMRPPLHHGMTEDWVVRGAGGDSTSLRIVWHDSARSPEGTLDWTGTIGSPDHPEIPSDTVVLRFLDFRMLLDSGVSRPGSTSTWLRASCWMPFPLEPLSDSLAGLLDARDHYAWMGTEAWTLINRLVPGADDLDCSNRHDNPFVPFHWNGMCYENVVGECIECRDVPQEDVRPGFGVVRRKSLAQGRSWELRSLDGVGPELSRGRSLAWPRVGEAWVWKGGEGSDASQRRLLVLDVLPDSAGIPGWGVQLATMASGRPDAAWRSELRIDSLRGWVSLGTSSANLWNPNPGSDAEMALGFLADWTVAEAETTTVFSYGTTTFCWGPPVASSRRSLVAARGVGAIRLASAGNPYGGPSYSWVLSLDQHTPEGGAMEVNDRHREGSPADILRLRLGSQPGLLLRRIGMDGRVRMARGSAALHLLSEPGVAVLVVGEGPDAQSFRIVNP